MIINPVYAADDDEYIQLNDFYTYSAYHYWESYGFSVDQSYTYTDTYSTSGTFSYGASISMTASTTGSESGSISGSFALEFEQAQWTGAIYVPKSVDVTITPDSGQTGAMSYPSFGCVYNANSTASNALMTCTPNGNSVFTQDTYTMELNTLGDTGGYGGLAAYIRPSGGGDAVGTITASSDAPFHAQFTMQESTNGSGQFSGTGSLTMTTTTVNTNNLSLALPVMKATAINNNFGTNISHPAKTLRNYSDDPVTIIYLADTTGINFGSSTSLFNLYDINNTNRLLNKKIFKHVGRKLSYLLIAESIYTDSISNGSEFFLKWSFPNPIPNIIPIYVGYFSTIPDDLFRWVYGEDRTLNELASFHDDMVTGTSGSQSAASQLNQQQTNFEGATNEMVNLESDTFSAVSNAIGNVNIDNNVLVGNGFLNAANWVRVQFDNLTSYPAFNSVLVFSLSLGFALLIIGKVR